MKDIRRQVIGEATVKVGGKTVTRRLNAHETKLYKEWIANDRRMRRLITQMRQIAAKAEELKIRQATAI